MKNSVVALNQFPIIIWRFYLCFYFEVLHYNWNYLKIMNDWMMWRRVDHLRWTIYFDMFKITLEHSKTLEIAVSKTNKFVCNSAIVLGGGSCGPRLVDGCWSYQSLPWWLRGCFTSLKRNGVEDPFTPNSK